ncbi:MAG: hypothetical protein DRP08_08065 [Candidatus Aenigmatarchaeota archaeon]|nr:MAG: hypothetical protein DRP08_08065 [Candidatus Aenigmarchaeota archaeon]
MIKYENIGWILFRITKFREDLKQVEWQQKGALFKELQEDLINRLVFNKGEINGRKTNKKTEETSSKVN